jgi:hypothetical protein
VLTWSQVTIAGMGLDDFVEVHGTPLGPEDRQEIDEQVRRAAYHIIAGKGATYYGIGSAVARLVDVILHDQRVRRRDHVQLVFVADLCRPGDRDRRHFGVDPPRRQRPGAQPMALDRRVVHRRHVRTARLSPHPTVEPLRTRAPGCSLFRRRSTVSGLPRRVLPARRAAKVFAVRTQAASLIRHSSSSPSNSPMRYSCSRFLFRIDG